MQPSAVCVVTHLFTFVGYAATLVTGEEEHAERVCSGTYCACLQETCKLSFAAIWNAAGSPYRACVEVWYSRGHHCFYHFSPLQYLFALDLVQLLKWLDSFQSNFDCGQF